MAFQDFLLRARRPASLIAFNGALPNNFKFIHKPESTWIELPGANLDPIVSLELAPGIRSTAIHYNLRVTDAWRGWNHLIEESDPDFSDDRLDKSKVKQWFKNNGIEKLDTAGEHPRSGRADMRWFRWTDGTEWLDITIDKPVFRRRIWLKLN